MTTPISGILGVDLTATPTTAAFALGTTTKGSDGTEWVYVQANAAITQYRAVGIDENYQAALLTKAMVDDGWGIGFAQVAFADDDYGWVATKGSNINCWCLGSCAADVALYSSGTAGALDDDASGQTKVDGVVAVAAVATAAAATEIIATFPKSTTF